MVPTDLRYTNDHEWVRVDGDEATIGITAYAADQLGDIVFVELPDAGRAVTQAATFGVVESVKAVSDLFAPVGGDVVEANAELGANPELVNSDPYGRGWMIPSPSPTRPSWTACSTPTHTTPSSPPADRTPMPYGPHTADDRQRMLAALGLTSVDQLFEDIPVALRASQLDLPEPEPELELAARLTGLAARNRTDLASFLGAGVYRHWSPPAVDQLLLRGEWYTAYTPYQPEISQGRSRASTSTSRCWPSWSTWTSSRRPTTTGPQPPPKPP